MDYVNIQVAIAGDTGNTVPKFQVPVSEIPVLQALHGEDAVFDFELVENPVGVEELSNRDEMQRLNSIYGHVTDRHGENVLRQVYSGSRAQVITELDDLDLPEGAFAVKERAVPADKPKKAPAKKTATKKAAVKDEGPADLDSDDNQDDAGNEDGILG